MGYRTAVVIYRDDTFELTSYGNGSGYEILKLGTQGDTDWHQDDSATEFRAEFDAALERGEQHEVLGRYWAERV